MILRRVSVGALLVLLILFFCFDASALAAAKKVPPPDPRKLVLSVDPKTNSFVVQSMRDKSKHTYKVDDMTRIKVNNQDGKFADIKVGMVVDDSIERDYDTLDSLNLSGYGTTADGKKVKAPPKPKTDAPPPL
jgi:hypothetical protein